MYMPYPTILMEIAYISCHIRRMIGLQVQGMADHGESKATYICISCQPFLMRSVKIQNEYEKAQAMFEETQKCSNTSSWSDPIIEATPQTGSFASTQMPDEPDTKFELPSISNLKVGIFTKGLQQLLEDQRPTKNDSTYHQ